MTGDVAAFLAARLDEIEGAAKAAMETWPFASLDSAASIPGNGPLYAWTHVTMHDPARALREVEAFRAILVLHKIEVAKAEIYRYDPCTGERNPDEYEVTCEICGWAGDDPSSACTTLRHLAAIFSSHPEYRESWKP